MSAAARLAAFAALLVAALAAGAGLGAAVGPDPAEPREVSTHGGGEDREAVDESDMGHGSP